MADGSVLLVEMQRRTLTRVGPDGQVIVVAQLHGGPNGAAMAPDGRCVVCNNGGLQFSQVEGALVPGMPSDDYTGGWVEAVDLATGTSEVLFRECNGIGLQAPNDLVFDRHGGFYFTDSGKVRALDRGRGAIYYARLDPASIRRVVFPVEGANGIGLSPDESRLYVAESATGRLWVYEIEQPGSIRRTRSAVPWLRGAMLYSPPHYSIPDSLAVEQDGNICVADIPTGAINVISPAGELLEQHHTGDAFTTNICFGGADGRTAYVTLSSSGRLVRAEWPRVGLTQPLRVR